MPTVTPRPASEIIKKTGCVIKPNWSLYENYKWQPMILELGIMNTRGKLGREKNDVPLMKPLSDAGVRHCATIVQTSGGVLDKSAAEGNIDAIAGMWGGAKNVIAIEGPNEFNNTSTRPANWASLMREFVEWLHRTVRSRSELNEILVAGPSIWKRTPADYKALGNIDAFVDRNTLHWYTDTRPPSGGTSTKTLNQAIVDVGILSKKAIFATEIGYSNHVSPKVKAKYLLRLFMEMLLRSDKIEQFYNFELSDTDPSPLWGLADAGFEKRPAFHAVKNFLALYKDSAASFTPSPIDIDVSAASTAKLLSLVHGKSDGSLNVMLSRDIIAQDNDAAPASVKITLGKQMTAEHIQPTFDPTPKKIGSGTIFNLPVTDQLTVLRLY